MHCERVPDVTMSLFIVNRYNIKKGGMLKGRYAVYIIETQKPGRYLVERRYSDFEWL